MSGYWMIGQIPGKCAFSGGPGKIMNVMPDAICDTCVPDCQQILIFRRKHDRI